MKFCFKRTAHLLAAVLLLDACASTQLPAGDFALSLPPPDALGRSPVALQDYRVGPFDKLSINVFQMKDLNLEKIQVDAGGNLLLPFVGALSAQGKTTTELSKEIAEKLAECCLQQPQVTVMVAEAISQQITVTGAVVESNVYTLRGRTTLMQAISMAKGPDRATANLKRVAVWRQSNGGRVGVLFNIEDIRAGKAPDPEIVGGDTIIVDSSSAKQTWHELAPAIPVLGVLTTF